MALSDVAIRKSKPDSKPYKIADADGLSLLVNPSGAKLWRFRYRWQGREQMLSLGKYPSVSLAEARWKRDELRSIIAKGINPTQDKKSGESTLTAVFEEWFTNQAKVWTITHQIGIRKRVSKNLLAVLGDRDIREITAPDLLSVLRAIESRGSHDMAHRVKIIFGQVARYAIATGRADRDVSSDLRGALAPVARRHHPTILDPKKIGELLRGIDGYGGYVISKLAMQLLPLFFVRPGELRTAEWVEFNFGKKIWEIPAVKMKMKVPHIVPLSKRSIVLLEELRPLTGNLKYLFPSIRDAKKPISDMTLNAALHRLGYTSEEIVPHGFRAMARTLLDEELKFRPDYIEHQLAHAVRDPLGRAYNRTQFLPERAEMMQSWADYLDKLKKDIE